MGGMKKIAKFLAVAVVASASVAAGESSPYWFAGDDASVFPLVSAEFHEVWLLDRLSIGLEASYSTLTDAKRSPDKMSGSTFVGFIYKLDDTDRLSFSPRISWWAAPNLRIGLFRDAVSGRTRNYNTTEHHSDGVVKTAGPAFVAEAVLPLLGDTLFLRAGGGFAWEKADFDTAAWWHLGYASENAWRAYGSPSVPNGHYREIHVDDAFGFLLCCGVSWRPIPRMELDAGLRHVWLEPDCDYGYRRGNSFDVHSSGDFTLDHLSFTVSVSYVF